LLKMDFAFKAIMLRIDLLLISIRYESPDVKKKKS